ncbi:MAG: ferredoxin [Dethiosulfovibrio sp.]|nr:ferredoxin [Dethiosulfovibrio sp.]
MRVVIEGERCIGCGVCVQICPDAFTLDETRGIARVIRPEGARCVLDARDSCPVSCIIVEE